MRWILAAAGSLAVLLGARRVRSARAREALAARRSTATADALAAEVRALILAGALDLPGAAERFVRDEPWTDASLLGEIDALHADAMRHDDRAGHTGREGAVFAFYDTGVAAVGEVLAKRLSRAPAS